MGSPMRLRSNVPGSGVVDAVLERSVRRAASPAGTRRHAGGGNCVKSLVFDAVERGGRNPCIQLIPTIPV
jgi:hypothetical protein